MALATCQRSGGHVAALVLLFSLAGSAASAAAQFLEAYKRGLDAMVAKDWAAAARHLRAAIADRAEEKLRLPMRNYSDPYLPHYQLGLALYELGDCDGALEAWSESERQGVIAKRPEMTVVAERRSACRQRGDDFASARERAERSIAQAARAADALRADAESPAARAGWSVGSPSRAARERAALEALERARSEHAASSSPADLERLATAARLADEAQAALEALRIEAGQLVAQHEVVAGELEQQRAKLDTVLAAAGRLLKETAPLAPYPPQLRKQRAELEELLKEATANGNAENEKYLAGLQSRIEFSADTLRQAAARPPEGLIAAAEAYFSGDWPRVLELLPMTSPPPGRATAHAHLLRAAAAYNLYVEAGARDPELLDRLLEDVRACRRADASLTPPERLFSPRFRELFSSADSAGVAAPPP